MEAEITRQADQISRLLVIGDELLLRESKALSPDEFQRFEAILSRDSILDQFKFLVPAFTPAIARSIAEYAANINGAHSLLKSYRFDAAEFLMNRGIVSKVAFHQYHAEMAGYLLGMMRSIEPMARPNEVIRMTADALNEYRQGLLRLRSRSR